MTVRECLTAEDIANQISMMRSTFKGTVIVVEGVTDSRLYGKFADRDLTEIVVAHSKDNVRGAVRTSSGSRKDGRVIGIVDSDLDRLSGTERAAPMFSTDCRDAEMMMFRSEAFFSVVSEYCDNDKLEAFAERFGDMRDAVVSASYPIGLLMYISSRDRLGLLFKDLEPGYFINPRSLSADIRRLVNEVVGRSRSDRIRESELFRRLKSEMEVERDPYDVCRGHDTVSILLMAIQNGLGGFNSRALREGELAGALRLAFSRDMFEDTELYRLTSEWCAEHNMPLWSVRSRSPPSPSPRTSP